MTNRIRRREFLTLLGGAAAAWPLAARAQRPSRVRRIGTIMNGLPTDRQLQSYIVAFEQVLRTLGWRNGENLHIDYRWYSGDVERARAYAAELVALAPDLIVTASSTVLTVMQQATKSIPIIFTSVNDPVAQGFVQSLAHPDGNITGFTALEYSIGGKWLDLVKQFSPTLARAAFIFNPASFPQAKYFLSVMEAAAPSLGVEVLAVPIHDRAGIEPAIAGIARAPNSGLIVPTDTFLAVYNDQVVELAARHRLPAIYARREYVEAGGLMYYANVVIDGWRGAAFYVDRVLKGAKPADLPVQQPVKFELVINLKAAAALGIELPMGLMLRADEVIE
jgi:putative ABC transport system substrate-binding protein